MENIRFKMLTNDLVLLTFEVEGIKVQYSGLAAGVPTWISVNDNVIMPFNTAVHDTWKAWNHNRKYADVLAKYILK